MSVLKKATQQLPFGKLGPAAKLGILKGSHLLQRKMNSFFRATSKNLALAGIRKRFSIFASRIRRYYSFCELRERPFSCKRKDLHWAVIHF